MHENQQEKPNTKFTRVLILQALTADDKEKVPGGLKGKWDKLTGQQSSRAIEYNITTFCLENSSTEKCWRLRKYLGSYHNTFALLNIFLLVIDLGYHQKQDTGQDRHLVKPSIIFVLLLNKYSWWKLSSWHYFMVNLEYSSHLGADPSFFQLRIFDINSLTPFSQHISAVYWIILL